MRTAYFHRGEAILIGGELCSTDFTKKLSLRTIVFVKKRLWSSTARAGAVIRDIAFRPATDRTNLFTITLFVVKDEIFIVPILPEVCNPREFIYLEFLIFRGMGIIESPLLKRNIFADKVEKPTKLFMLVLNKLK